ncbi:MAG: acylneuraminate cytidylyltransferase family protein [Phycisphaerales bacterium]
MAGGAVAIVLGRAGSKGVPGKNTRIIAGKPCAAWTIEHAQQTPGVDLVVVSTDSEELKTLAQSMGAQVVERPDELAGDTATVDDAARHAMESIADSHPWTTDPLQPTLILYANVPVRPADLSERALKLLRDSGCDSVQSYERVGKHHPWWMVTLDETGALSPWEGDVLNHGVFRRQDLPPAHLPDGGVIALTRRSLMLEIADVQEGPHGFFGKDRRGIVSPSGAVVDIDEEADVVRAEILLGGGVSAHR